MQMSINSLYEYSDFVATAVIALNKTAKFIKLSHMCKKKSNNDLFWCHFKSFCP